MSARPVYLSSGGPSADRKLMAEDLGKALAACGAPSPRVAYVGTANKDSLPFFGAMRELLLRAGAGGVEMAHIAGRRAEPEKAAEILKKADAVFLSGGEVEDGIVWLKKAGLDGLLGELYEDGKQFFGISAGCIMMGEHWVHWDKEGDDSTSSLFDCLGFVPFTFDAHGEREDWTELKCALRLMGPGAKGFGLTDGGFFRADAQGSLESFHGGPARYENRAGSIEMVK